jgi:hypothetical protein
MSASHGGLGSRDQEEEQLTKQLSKIRAAITALGSNLPYIVTGRGSEPMQGALVHNTSSVRKRRRLSAKARAAISRAQKQRWAKLKAGRKK